MDLFESFRSYADPQNILEYHFVYNATVCKLETVRYRFMATAVTANQQEAGLESLFVRTNGVASIPGMEKAVKMEAAKGARRYLTDPRYPCKIESLKTRRCM